MIDMSNVEYPPKKAEAEASSHPSPYPGMSALLTALLAVMNDVKYVQKGGENEFHGYKYATEADTIAAVRPALIKHGLVLVPSMLGGLNSPDANGNTSIVMRYRLYHAASGQCISIDIPASGNDRNSRGGVGDKGVYKAMTGAMKYALRQLLMLETGEDPEKGSEHDQESAKNQAATHVLLKTADSLMDLAHHAQDVAMLETIWRDNLGSIELLKTQHHDLYVRVRDAFGARKRQITGE